MGQDGIVGGVVEVAPGDDPVDADGGERIRQEPEPLDGDPPPWLRLRRPAVLGRVVVHEHGEGTVLPVPTLSVIPGLTTFVIPGLTGNLLDGGDRCPIGVGHDGRRRRVGHDGGTSSSKHTQEDVPGGHDGVRSIEVAGFGVNEFQAGGAIQESDVDAAAVGGVVMDILVVQFAERGLLEHLPKAFAFAWNRFQVQCRSPAAENSTSDTVVESFRQSKKFSTFQNIKVSSLPPISSSLCTSLACTWQVTLDGFFVLKSRDCRPIVPFSARLEQRIGVGDSLLCTSKTCTNWEVAAARAGKAPASK